MSMATAVWAVCERLGSERWVWLQPTMPRPGDERGGRDASRDTPGKNRPVLDLYQSLRNLESASYENDAYQEKREGTFSGAGDGFDFLC